MSKINAFNEMHNDEEFSDFCSLEINDEIMLRLGEQMDLCKIVGFSNSDEAVRLIKVNDPEEGTILVALQDLKKALYGEKIKFQTVVKKQQKEVNKKVKRNLPRGHPDRIEDDDGSWENINDLLTP